jgi:tetratricopeptide (TPR) repeat protein
MMLAAGATSANPLDDAKAGKIAFDKGDNSAAERLFTSAINSRRLTRADQELAFVKRAEARIALGKGQAALADAYSALNLDPADNEAIATRDRAQAMLTPPPERTAAAASEPASYLKSQTAYQEALKRYEEQKNSDAKRYDEQLAKYNAELKAQQAREAQISALRSTPGGSQTAPAPTSQPKVQATAQPAPKPAAKPAQKKPVRKVTPAPVERPPFY